MLPVEEGREGKLYIGNFVSGNFGKSEAWKVCLIFNESYFHYFKDSQ